MFDTLMKIFLPFSELVYLDYNLHKYFSLLFSLLSGRGLLKWGIAVYFSFFHVS